MGINLSSIISNHRKLLGQLSMYYQYWGEMKTEDPQGPLVSRSSLLSRAPWLSKRLSKQPRGVLKNGSGAYLLTCTHIVCLSHMNKTIGAHVCNPISQEIGTQGTAVLDHPPLCSKLETSLGQMKPFLKRKEKRGERKEGKKGRWKMGFWGCSPFAFEIFLSPVCYWTKLKIFRGKKMTCVLLEHVKLPPPTTSAWQIPCTYCSVNNFREPGPASSFTESLWKGLS